VSIIRIAGAVLALVIAGRMMFVGVRDGMARRRVVSRWIYDKRELTGAAAIWYGAIISFVGAVVAAGALWILLRSP
jgi:hypothetical protein